jgi:predicted AAA+ superfamily ATPase
MMVSRRSNPAKPVFRRPVFELLAERMHEPRRFLQVLAGPRQTGKTTLAQQVLQASGLPTHYASADEPGLKGSAWLAGQWEVGREGCRASGRKRAALLALDEIHKIAGWSETVKRLWDEDTAARLPLRVLLLGSSPLLIQAGLAESLAGRFELLPVTHWSFGEMRDAFGWSLERYLVHGGYPGAAPLVRSPARWSRYLLDSLIETTIARDVLLMTRVDKPALLRQLFVLGCRHSGEILSYNKMLGQLHDAGNTTTLAHYLGLLSAAGMVTGLSKHSGSAVRQRSSSPKLLVLNTALMTAALISEPDGARMDPAFRGRLVESAVGAHLVNSAAGSSIEVLYWREGAQEVDFVLRRGERIVAIEVKSGWPRDNLPGLEAFTRRFAPTRVLLVGPGGIPVDQFLGAPASEWIGG